MEIQTRRKTSVSEKILMSINNNNRTSSRIAKVIGCTYSHSSKLIKDLKNDGLVTFERGYANSRDKPMVLTKKGIKVRDILIQLNEVYNE